MCGIAGIISNSGNNANTIRNMLSAISHRGPDNEGIWSSDNNSVVLGHRRLSIIDLSSNAHQPMTSQDGRYCITFNGEIYNFKEIRAELEVFGIKFATKSDTEVILYAYEKWGIKMLDRLNGMFSFAIWDEREKELFAARDPMGEKPFKYFESKSEFVFASEIKALLEYPGISRDIDWSAIDIALSFRFVPSPKTGFTQIKKLPAGHYLIWKNGETKVFRYWDIGNYCANKNISFNEAKKEVWNLFCDSTQLRMISDVSVGAFLSGGIDSTSVVAAMAERSTAPIETFVISMGGESDDQKYARIAARAFRTNHHEIAVSDINYEKEIGAVALAYDEPFFDQSALPTTIISRYIKKYATVVLSGDGGDELFGGYDSYINAEKFRLFSRILETTKDFSLPLADLIAGKYKTEILSRGFNEGYTEYVSLWKNELPRSKKYITKDDLYIGNLADIRKKKNSLDSMVRWLEGGGSDIATHTMIADIRGRLADGYLTKTDIGTMQSALELRTPFLDHRLAEFAFSLPTSYKIHRGVGKYVWREAIKEKVPKEILTRRKMGFAIPLDEIVNNEMKNFTKDTLLPNGALIHSVCKKDVIEKMIIDHRNKKADYSNHIWSLLMLELWLQNYTKK